MENSSGSITDRGVANAVTWCTYELGISQGQQEGWVAATEWREEGQLGNEVREVMGLGIVGCSHQS